MGCFLKTGRVNADLRLRRCGYLVLIVLFLLCMPGSITGHANGHVQSKNRQKNREISLRHRVSPPLSLVQYLNTKQGIREPLIASQENGGVNHATPQQARTKRAVRQLLVQAPVTNAIINCIKMHNKKAQGFAKKHPRLVVGNGINKREMNDTLEMLNFNVTLVGDLSHGDPRGAVRGYLAQKNGREQLVVQKNEDGVFPIGQQVNYYVCSDIESCLAIVNRKKGKDSRIVCNEQGNSCYIIDMVEKPVKITA